jgi:hypothetical protein
MGFPMARERSSDQYDEKEAKARFEAAPRAQ